MGPPSGSTRRTAGGSISSTSSLSGARACTTSPTWCRCGGRGRRGGPTSTGTTRGPKLLVAEGIDMARRLFSRCYFHETTCGAGLDHLGAYHYAWEERKQEYGKEPVHDEHSHAADAFRTFAVCPTEHNEEIGRASCRGRG